MAEAVNVRDPLEVPDKKVIIDQTIDEYVHLPGAAMVVLNNLQGRIGYITKPMQSYIAERMNVPLSKIHGVVSFYSFFTTEPRGKHLIKFCIGTACYVGGAEQLIDKTKQVLGIAPGQTTPDGLISVEVCRCVGACSQAPVIVVDEINHGRMQPTRINAVVTEIQQSELENPA
ncbi:MAG: NAD(P)H-dependent oxidoreductase subunit E [Anaerolineaceae bacterium]|nr:NAD(P)H-dependent oxidoreductase subunit E [Anaerolineaceae bacterium]